MNSICFPPSAYCPLPTEFEGNRGWRDSLRTQQPGTRSLPDRKRGNSSNFKKGLSKA
jgi:hypothetical protein